MELTAYKLIVSEGKKAFYENALAAVFFSIFIFLLGITIYNAIFDTAVLRFLFDLRRTIGVGLYCFFMGLSFLLPKQF
jgi:hypothetical protein